MTKGQGPDNGNQDIIREKGNERSKEVTKGSHLHKHKNVEEI